ncbi:MAG: AsmA family protein, partial [Desulfobacteraceae bacterium]
MTRRKKIFRIAIIVVGAFFVLLLAFQIIVPRLINLESIKGKILASASEKVGGEVKCQKLGLSFFPYPHAVIDQATLTIPGKVSGSIDALGVYAKFLPLLKGKLQIAQVTLESPVFEVALPKKATKKPKKELPASSLDIPTLATQIVASLILEAPNLEVEIGNGRLDLFQEDESLFFFNSIDAQVVLPPEGFKLRLSCISNLWEKMGVKSTLNTTDYKGDVNIELGNFQPHRLTSHLLEDASLKLADSSVNMSVDLNVNGLNNLQGKVEGSIPLLSFLHRNQNTVIKGKSLKSTFRLDENEIKFSLDELYLEFPEVNLSGDFLLDRGTPRVKLELEGRDVDVPTVREVALALAGDVSDVQEIFGIVRGGKVPLITVRSEGSTYDQLGDLKNILIKGHMVEGKILVPDVELDLANVKGETVISGGVLQGEKLEARVGNSWGRDGRLKLGLAEGDDSFHLDIGVQADLAELPPIMKRLIEDKVFQEEIALIKNLKGNAEGRLVLGETTESVNARVDVSKLHLSAKYKRIPYPIRIKGGHFSYDKTGIGVKDMTGEMGKSSFSQLTAKISLNKDPYLEVKSGIFDFFLEEIYAWLVSIEGSPIRPEDIKTLQGDIHIASLSLKGPLLKPGKWQTKTSWETRNALVDLSLLPAPVKISKGNFEGQAD